MKLFPILWVISCGVQSLLGFCGSFQAWALHVVTFCIQRKAQIASVSLILLSLSWSYKPHVCTLLCFCAFTALGNSHCFSALGQVHCLFLCYRVSNATEHTVGSVLIKSIKKTSLKGHFLSLPNPSGRFLFTLKQNGKLFSQVIRLKKMEPIWSELWMSKVWTLQGSLWTGEGQTWGQKIGSSSFGVSFYPAILIWEPVAKLPTNSSFGSLF